MNVHIDTTWPDESSANRTTASSYARAPTREHAVETAARRIGLMEGGCVGPSVVYEVLACEDYPEPARPGDYTLSVVHEQLRRHVEMIELERQGGGPTGEE